MSFLDIRDNGNPSAGFFINSPFDFPGEITIIDPYSAYSKYNDLKVISGVRRAAHPNMYLTGYLPHVHSGCAPFDGPMECAYDVFDVRQSGATGSLFLGRVGGSCGAIAVFVETISGSLFTKGDTDNDYYTTNRGPDAGQAALIDLPFANNTDPCPPGSSEATQHDAIEGFHYTPFKRVIVWPDGDYSIKRVPYHIKPIPTAHEGRCGNWNNDNAITNMEFWFQFSIRVTPWFPSGGAHGPPKENCKITHGDFVTGLGHNHSGGACASDNNTYYAMAWTGVRANSNAVGHPGHVHYIDPLRASTKARGLYPSAIVAGPQAGYAGKIKQSGANGATGVSNPITDPRDHRYGRAYWTGYAFSGTQILPSWHRNIKSLENTTDDAGGKNISNHPPAWTLPNDSTFRKSTGGHGVALIRMVVNPGLPDEGGDTPGGGGGS